MWNDFTITFEFFGNLRRLAGRESLEMRVPRETLTVNEALAALAGISPDLSSALQKSACAVGNHLVRRDDTLASGTRLALLPPVAGG